MCGDGRGGGKQQAAACRSWIGTGRRGWDGSLHSALRSTANCMLFCINFSLTYLHTFLCRESILFKHTDDQFVHLSVVWCVEKGHSGLSTMQQLDPCWPLAYNDPREACCIGMWACEWWVCIRCLWPLCERVLCERVCVPQSCVSMA